MMEGANGVRWPSIPSVAVMVQHHRDKPRGSGIDKEVTKWVSPVSPLSLQKGFLGGDLCSLLGVYVVSHL